MILLALDLSSKSKELIQDRSQLEKYNKKNVVYLLVFPNSKIYCGYSSNIIRRWHGPSEYKSQPLVSRAIEKYGWTNIKKYIYNVYDNSEEGLKAEYNFIKKYDLTNPNKGYNMVDGGGNPPHGIQYISEEGYQKMVENGKRLAQNVWTNPERAAYCIKRMKEETHKKRMLMDPIERKEKYGKHHIGVTPLNAKPILQIDLQTGEILKEYPSARQAAIGLGLDPTAGANIQRTARGIGKSAYGYTWRWKNDIT